MTMTLVSTITGPDGSSAMTFSNIPQTGKDLYLVVSARTIDASGFYSARMYFNGNTTGYTTRILQGNGASVVSQDESYFLGINPSAGMTANTFSSNSAYIPNYAGSTNKSYSIDSVTENNATTSYQIIGAGTWANTAAITSITIIYPSNIYSSASLYTISTTGATGATVA